jgi:hypothetical protein
MIKSRRILELLADKEVVRKIYFAKNDEEIRAVLKDNWIDATKEEFDGIKLLFWNAVEGTKMISSKGEELSPDDLAKAVGGVTKSEVAGGAAVSAVTLAVLGKGTIEKLKNRKYKFSDMQTFKAAFEEAADEKTRDAFKALYEEAKQIQYEAVMEIVKLSLEVAAAGLVGGAFAGGFSP